MYKPIWLVPDPLVFSLTDTIQLWHDGGNTRLGGTGRLN